MASSKRQHKQNEYGLSYPAMIVLAIQNSPTAIDSTFCNRAVSVQDVYTFLKAHVAPFQEMSGAEWTRTEKVLRHSLSQTTYFHRIAFDGAGGGLIVPSKATCAFKGALWTLHPTDKETAEKATKRIQKAFKKEHMEKFRRFLVNGAILEELRGASWGWRGPRGESLGESDAARKLDRRDYSLVASETCQRTSRKRRAEPEEESRPKKILRSELSSPTVVQSPTHVADVPIQTEEEIPKETEEKTEGLEKWVVTPTVIEPQTEISEENNQEIIESNEWIYTPTVTHPQPDPYFEGYDASVQPVFTFTEEENFPQYNFYEPSAFFQETLQDPLHLHPFSLPYYY
ncbi:hypothetical protein QR680_008139 [Steinernema hermaphroditum]|uniref:Fork-head domain-containing protein n=1 Tax=Steinernema hermaphroditum TaxID=289476 RepID=A0AA39M7K0_9BILA|nr:hypothetical protein QR680_008139 [Steinernema hermaphroditum]